jgi:hypothetical protein
MRFEALKEEQDGDVGFPNFAYMAQNKAIDTIYSESRHGKIVGQEQATKIKCGSTASCTQQ